MFPFRFLRRRWVLAVIFLLSFTYYLYETLNQVPLTISDQFQDVVPTPQQIALRTRTSEKLKFNLTSCRNSRQGKIFVVDEKGYVCSWKDLLANGCCNPEAKSSSIHNCNGCSKNGCCVNYERCVSCCMHPEKEHVLQDMLGKASHTFRLLFQSVADHFELCLTKCRTSSQSVQHENTYRDPDAKHCYGETQPELKLNS
ncbi:SREBP regulating gene protein-like isoform X1 [Lytechinus pictus]|uniref:SREBP regulating gene protein-like n=1 Tax=Lytechinus variegatus TaxID=7654 RepID=UPI001BB18E38|nr:SREBP regulating gene protein-like [Lytechinus variegatus]XP_041456806.1 SREBP regulating gene protein-like [Lytechinus variegatus]